MKKILLLVAMLIVAAGGWQLWRLSESQASLERARQALRDGEFRAAVDELAAWPSSLLGDSFGLDERAADLAPLAAGASELAGMQRGELIAFERVAVEQAPRFPAVAAAVAGEVARRLRQCVPDPIMVSAVRTLRLRAGHAVQRLAIGNRDLPRRADGLFDAGALVDDHEPREVRLADPHGFQAITRAVVRVDFTPPVVLEVTAPPEVQPGALFRIECRADEPVFAVAEATVRGGRLLGIEADGTERLRIRVKAGTPEEPGQSGYVLWSFRVRDRVGNVSEPVKGRVEAR